jgi:phage terminase small subunit
MEAVRVAKLTAKQQRFVQEYLVDLNATQAYLRAGYKVSETVSAVNAQRLLRNAKVQEVLSQAMQERAQRTEITADMVLQHWWDIGTADPNDIIQFRRVCCRHCYGVDHQYQWRDEEEYQQTVQLAARAAAEQGKEPAPISDAGGYGFDRLLRPHPQCPYCRGEGIPEIHIEDTRYLSPKAKLLYAGVKQTQAGIEVKMRDQDKAMENVARHLGMFKDSLDVNIKKKLEDFM